MKKITLALCAAFSSFSMAYSQANISVEAPIHNTNYIDLLPMGSADESTLTAIYLVNASELSSLTGTALTSLGIQIDRGVTGTAVSGTLEVYIKNTTDVTYSLGTSYTTEIQSMTNEYNGNFTVPSSQNSSTVNLTFPQTFTYTGGGIYVALKWVSTGPFVTAGTNNANLAAYPSNTGVTGTEMGAIEEGSATTSITGVMSEIEARPSFLFRAVNSATNEVGVIDIIAPGKVARSIGAGHIISAWVKNNTVNPLSNVTVTLAVGGANTFTNVQTIASLPAGSTATVMFAAFNPTVFGINHVSVTISPDQNNANNSLVWTQSVTCNIMANNPPDAISSFTGAVGFPSGSGIFSTEFTPAASTTLTGVRIAVSTDTDNIGKSLYSVIMDNSGTILAASDTVTVTASINGNFRTFKFSPGIQMDANTGYFIGLAQSESNHFPMAYDPGPFAVNGQFFASPITGGGFNNSNFGYFGIEPILGPDISVVPSTTNICKGESVDLVADGANTYTWTVSPTNATNTIASPNSSSISVTPFVTGTAATSTVVYTLKGTDATSGCTNSVTTTIRLNACTGITTNVLKDANIILFPNPAANGKCAVSGLEGKNTITVYNMLGEVVLTKSTNDASVSIDVTSQPSGNYMVKVTDENNHSKTLKFINQH